MISLKKILTAVLLLILVHSAFAEIINVNPDKNGEPWLVGGFEMTPQDVIDYSKLPQLQFTPNRSLPVKVDNSLLPAFRPIFSQQGGSCAQASGIGYIFTYEINTVRGLASDVIGNQYPSHFTWNYLNNGAGAGSNTNSGWSIVKGSGCPTVAEYGGTQWFGGDKRWMSGYDVHFSALKNRIVNTYSITSLGTTAGLNNLKQWFYDHGNGSAKGGITGFSAGATDYTMTTLPTGTPNGGKKVITKWGPDVNHAMTFVGYDDEIKYDFNNDGQYTNNIDINGDGTVNMKDWEIGGLIVVNSWGTGWGTSGKAYMPYKLLAEPVSNGGIWGSQVITMEVATQTTPKLALKVKVKYTSRDKLNLLAGISTDTLATTAQQSITLPLLANHRGGSLFMQGGTTEADKTIEYALDITSLVQYANNKAAKIFFSVDRNDATNIGSGSIVSMSVMDYTSGINNPTETICKQNNVTLNQGINTVSVVKRTWGVSVAPTVSITAPTANSSITIGNTVAINASTTGSNISKVEFYINNVLKSTDTASPYSYSWNTAGLSAGSFNIKTIAYNTANQSGTSNVNVNLVNPTYALTVTSGTGSGSYAANAMATITANTAPSGKMFDKWVANSGSPTITNISAASTTLKMPANVASVTATYKDIPVVTYALTVTSGTGSGSYAANATATITANTAPSGKMFDKWVANSGSPTITNISAASTTLKMPANVASVTATYKDVAGGPVGYTKCANENQSYTLSGTCDVAYGANGKFNYQYNKTGTISFNNATFGDPIPGIVKAGYYKTVAETAKNLVLPANGGVLKSFTSQYGTNWFASDLTDGVTNDDGWSSANNPGTQEFVYAFSNNKNAVLSNSVIYSGLCESVFYSKDVEVWVSANAGTTYTKKGSATLANSVNSKTINLGGVVANRIKLRITSGYRTDYWELGEFVVNGILSGSSIASRTDIVEESLPQLVELSQNYPNPFNPITTIKFALPNNGNVKLAVMNAKGETVKVLASGNYLAGNHSFDFDGSSLNSGVYFYQLTTPEKTITKKMMLIK